MRWANVLFAVVKLILHIKNDKIKTLEVAFYEKNF